MVGGKKGRTVKVLTTFNYNTAGRIAPQQPWQRRYNKGEQRYYVTLTSPVIQSVHGCRHLCLLDTVSCPSSQTFPAEIHRHCVCPRVGRTCRLNHSENAEQSITILTPAKYNSLDTHWGSWGTKLRPPCHLPYMCLWPSKSMSRSKKIRALCSAKPKHTPTGTCQPLVLLIKNRIYENINTSVFENQDTKCRVFL